MTQQLELPESLVKAAEERKWPLDLVRQGLSSGIPAARIEQVIRSGVSPQQAIAMLANARAGSPGATLQGLQANITPGSAGPPPLDMSWAEVPTERGFFPQIGPNGLELKDVEQSSYGIVPDYWPYENDMPRGSYLPPDLGNTPASYSIYKKSEVWAPSAAALYEEAIRGHWISATAIPWESLKPLPQYEELAIDQLCTNWSEQSHNGLECVSKWLEEISYGFHEVKLFLATVCFDYGRQTEAFRKRALANGGGLGLQTPGVYTRAAYSAMKFSEMATIVMVVRASFQITLWDEFGHLLARTDADRKLFELATRDLKRHLQYGLEHLHYFLQTEPHKRGQVKTWLSRGEAAIGAEWGRNKPHNEALMLLLDSDPRAAKAKLRGIWRRQVEAYKAQLESITIRNHELNPILARHLEEPVLA
ncbi:MAG TPA: hypothetical protein VNN10_14140 [Dehalococcoidia bacterium]|nr:hypothetical protein [Dehalococcoidia bacterium]